MLRSTIIRWAFALTSLCVVVSCSDAELTFGGPLALTVSSNAPITVTDSLVVNYDATGQSLLGLALLWGDGTVDSVFFAGAQSAAGRVAHLYAEDGAYTVTATVTDGLQGNIQRELDVTVSP